MAKVVRVFGKADDFDIELTQKGDKWEVDVPPDMTDGVYAVQLTAIDELGESSYWVGELYMVDGVCCLKFTECPYQVRFAEKNLKTHFRNSHYDVCCSSSLYEFEFKHNTSVQVKKNKHRKPNYVAEFVTNFKKSEYATQHTLHIKKKETELKYTAKLHTKCKPTTEIYFRKGCCCEQDCFQ